MNFGFFISFAGAFAVLLKKKNVGSDVSQRISLQLLLITIETNQFIQQKFTTI
jgi:hypothetical protein